MDQASRLSQKRSLPGRWKMASAAIAVLLGILVFLFLNVGRWLVREDPLQKARAIVILSGGMPVRALEAAKIYREGYAPEVWLTRPAEPRASMEALGIPFDGEDDFNQRVLIHEGVPPGAIRILDPPIYNTADEIRAVSSAMNSAGAQVVIVVTTKAHTRRVRALWNKLEKDRGRILVRAASGDSFDPAHWWHTTGDALDVLREILGLLNVWAGLPLRPAA
jgi:uncharacterized SAM-binding protein YcdF (DUF218 family)